MWWTRPSCDNNRLYSILIYTRSYPSLQGESIFTSFIIRGWSALISACTRIGLDNFLGQPVQSLVACAAPLLILVRAYLHWETGASPALAALLRIERKLINYLVPSVEITCCHYQKVGSGINKSHSHQWQLGGAILAFHDGKRSTPPDPVHHQIKLFCVGLDITAYQTEFTCSKHATWWCYKRIAFRHEWSECKHVWSQGATKAHARLPGASRSQIQASILKHQEITVAQLGQAESVLWTYDFQYKFLFLFLWGQVKMSFGQVLFIKFVLYVPEWASGDKHLYSTLHGAMYAGALHFTNNVNDLQ